MINSKKENESIYVPLIDPDDVENFDRTEREKEAFLLFTIFVAGKTAKVICQKSYMFHKYLLDYMSVNHPMLLRNEKEGVLKNIKMIPLEHIIKGLKDTKIGKYSVLSKLFSLLQEYPIDIDNIDLEDLEKLPGIGKKTSRYFMLYTFRNHKPIAILDRHVLKYLGYLGHDVPDSTPSGKMYDKIEKLFLNEYNKSDFNGSLPEFDLYIWKNKGKI